MKLAAKKKVLVGDKGVIFAEGVKAALERDFDVVSIATDGHTLLNANRALKPDVIVVDPAIPLMNGVETLVELTAQPCGPKVVVLTMAADIASVSEMLRVGVTGYVLKISPPSELLAAIDKVLKGGTYITPLLPFHFGKITRYFQHDERRSLTQREREVLELIAKGRTSREIAAVLNISTKTVESHRTNISRHLGIHSIAELTRYALEHGMV